MKSEGDLLLLLQDEHLPGGLKTIARKSAA